jgi:hypothetical protein
VWRAENQLQQEEARAIRSLEITGAPGGNLSRPGKSHIGRRRIYNRALSATEVKQLYKKGR